MLKLVAVFLLLLPLLLFFAAMSGGHLRFYYGLTGREIVPVSRYNTASTRITWNTIIEWYFRDIATAIDRELGSFVFVVGFANAPIRIAMGHTYGQHYFHRTRTFAAALVPYPGSDLYVQIIPVAQGSCEHC